MSPFYWKTIWKVWGLGYGADVIGVSYVLIISNVASGYSIYSGDRDMNSLMHQIMDGIRNVTHHIDSLNIFSFLHLGVGVIVAGVAIFLFDYFIAFRKTEMTKKQKIIMSLSLAIFTAPYTFFLPNPQY